MARTSRAMTKRGYWTCCPKSQTRNQGRGAAVASAPRRGRRSASSPCAALRLSAPPPARARDARHNGQRASARHHWGSHGKGSRATRRNRAVAMGTVLGPFTVSLKVKKAGLDLHDPDVSTWRQAHHVGAPPIRKRKLGHHGMSKRAKRPANAALDLGSHRRLTPIERHDGVQVLREIDLWGTIDHESALHRHVHA